MTAEDARREHQVPSVIECWELLGEKLPGPLGWYYTGCARLGKWLQTHV